MTDQEIIGTLLGAICVLVLALALAIWRWRANAKDAHEWYVAYCEELRSVRDLYGERARMEGQLADSKRTIERLRSFARTPNIGAAWRAVKRAYEEGIEEGTERMRRAVGRVERLRLSDERTREMLASSQARSPEPTGTPERATSDVPLRRFAKLDLEE